MPSTSTDNHITQRMHPIKKVRSESLTLVLCRTAALDPLRGVIFISEMFTADCVKRTGQGHRAAAATAVQTSELVVSDHRLNAGRAFWSIQIRCSRNGLDNCVRTPQRVVSGQIQGRSCPCTGKTAVERTIGSRAGNGIWFCGMLKDCRHRRRRRRSYMKTRSLLVSYSHLEVFFLWSSALRREPFAQFL
jgi:hypothetical protein